MRALSIAACAILLCNTACLTAAQDDARLARERLVRTLFPDLPAHPPFENEISLESPNAAARYMYLQRTMPDRIDQLSDWIEYNNPNQLAMAEGAEEYGLHVDELQAVLEQNQDWIAALIESTRLDTFDLYLKTRPLNAPFDPDDPRREGYLGFYRKAARILRADSIRHWSLGHREEAIERVAAIFRLGGQLRDNDNSVLQCLVAESILRTGIDSATALIDHATPPLSKRELLPVETVLPRFDADDPCGLFASWRTHSRMGIEFLDTHLASGEVDLEVEYLVGGLRGSEAMFSGLLKNQQGQQNPEEIAADMQKRILKETLNIFAELKPERERYEDAITALQLARTHKTHIEQEWQSADSLRPLSEKLESEVTEDQRYYYEIAIGGYRSIQGNNKDSIARLKEFTDLLGSLAE